jgi:signal-transduction protein with cAMP-binding, CBS, and nucleotidyltransferase domain
MMALLVSAKGSDILAWRACGDFSSSFRQSLLARLEFYRSNEAEALLLGTGQALDDLIAANDAFCLRCIDLIEELSDCVELPRLREIGTDFYAGLYDHVAIHKSAPAFYEFSTLFIQTLSRSIIRHVQAKLGLLDRQMPQVILVALGTAGRQEYSPFSPLQFMLVHGETNDAGKKALSQFGRLIHEGFEACGLRVDGIVTPRNPEWRGSMSEWRQRLVQMLEQGGVNELIELFKLADQSILCSNAGFNPEFNLLCRSTLKERRSAMAFQVTRVRNLSHGIGIMGGLRFEKKGPYRGLFALNYNALQPLSAAISIIGLIKDLEAASTPQRIREILWRRELNVDMAERLLQAWHALHELRLTRESCLQPDWTNESSLYVNIEEMHDSEQNLLRGSLETVGAIQRHVGLTFSGMEE